MPRNRTKRGMKNTVRVRALQEPMTSALDEVQANAHFVATAIARATSGARADADALMASALERVSSMDDVNGNVRDVVSAFAESFGDLVRDGDGGEEAAVVVAALGAALGAAAAAGNAMGKNGPGDEAQARDGGALPTTYDLDAIRAYWRRRPGKILRRSASLAGDVAGWVVAIVVDAQTKSVEKNSKKRAEALRDIVARQGAAFVKVAQAVAIRPDILPPAYLEALQTLLDQVAPFESEEARELIKAQLGISRLEDVFEDVRAFDKPIAAASIGQVYKAKVKRTEALAGEQGEWGFDVAVKVQRPNILDTVSLDLLVIRTILEALAGLPKTGALAQIQQGAAGFIPVLDVAAERFLEELDYGLEAKNAAQFEKVMSEISVVRGTIKVPHVFLSLSGRQVLTQEWVNGRKLTDIEVSNTTEETRKKLVKTLLNSYMIQLLETGLLHGDPHPGNFLLCADGRLCILGAYCDFDCAD